MWRRTAFLLCVLLACSRKTHDQPPPKKMPVPESVIASLSVGSLSDTVGAAATYVEQAQPGAGSLMTPDTVAGAFAHEAGATSLDGADLGGPFHALLLDPKVFTRPIVVVVKVRDRAALEKSAAPSKVRVHEGIAVVGESSALAAAGDWALGTLAADKPPTDPTVTFYMGTVMKKYSADLDKAMTEMSALMASTEGAAGMGKFIEWEVSFLKDTANQTDRAVVILHADAQTAWIDTVLVPRADTTLAGFCKAQKPTDHALLAKLSPDPAGFIVSGHLELGPLREPALKLVDQFTASFGPEWSALIRQVLDVNTGDFAAAASLGIMQPMQMVEVLGVNDSDRALQLSKKALALVEKAKSFDLMGLHFEMAVDPPATHDGIEVLSYLMKFDMSNLPDAQRQAMEAVYGDGMRVRLAAFNNVLAVGIGPDATGLEKSIDAAHGKPGFSPGPGLARALSESRARKDSMVMFMNLGAMITPDAPGTSGFVGSMGFADGSLHYRFELPAAALKALSAPPPL